MNLNDENIELYLFRYKEGLLDADDIAEVESALADHPNWKAMADMYDPELRLPAGITIEYDNAELLRDGGPKVQHKPVVIHKSSEKRRFIPLWITIAAAACVVLFVTTVIRFASVPVENVSQPVLASVPVIDTIKQLQDTVIEVDMRLQSPKMTKNYATASHHSDDAMLAAVDDYIEPSDYEIESEQAETPQIETQQEESPQSDDVKQTAIPTSPEINTPMEQELLFAEGIIKRSKEDKESKSSTSRGEQIRSIAIRATSLAANIAVSRQQRRYSFEESIENNEFFNNLIATIE